MRSRTKPARPAAWRAAALAALLAGACAEEADPEPLDEGAAPSVQALPTWEEFLAQSTIEVDGRELYVVEWDLPIDSLEELRAYYDELVRRRQAAASGDRDGIGASAHPLLVNRVNGQDDLWQGPTASQLTYCVSDAFGANQARMVQEMARAAFAWSSVANVGFVYVPSQNGNCVGTNTAIRIAVRPWGLDKARAFFPSDVRGDLWIDVPYFDNSAPGGAPNVTTEGVLRHELGHVLGFRHEHNAEPTGTCFEDSDWRSLTEYDVNSVMHYPWCNGVLTSDLRITPRDERGAVTAYGMAIAPLVELLD